MSRGEQLMHQWGIASWFKLNEWKKGRERTKITLVEVVINDMSITEITYSWLMIEQNNTKKNVRDFSE